jgi:hypothetical protein
MRDNKVRVTRMCRGVAFVWCLFLVAYLVLSIWTVPRAARPGEILSSSPLLQMLSTVLCIGLMAVTFLLIRTVRQLVEIRRQERLAATPLPTEPIPRP